jgi:PIN domain nuclease of toxin-antitoxin system
LKIDYVLDASAALAVLFQEPGQEVVQPLLPASATSAVNASEVLAMLQQLGASSEQAERTFSALNLEVLPFERPHASEAANLTPLTRGRGLSFGDRTCLATARLLKVPALTADRNWRIPKLGVVVRLIR